MKGHYHITHFSPVEGTWPRGGWSVYQITGDQIAQRVVCDGAGKIIERHSWCGFIGIFETLAEVTAAIEDAEAEVRAA